MEPQVVLEQLEKVLASAAFRSAERSSKILRYVVEQTIVGKGDQLKEYTIGAEALGRGPNFDPRIDAIARVEVSRLRSRLEQYYATAGQSDEIRFVLNRGSYTPEFARQSQTVTEPGSRRYLAIGVCLGLVVIAALIVLRSRMAPPTSTGLPLTLEVELGQDTRLANIVGPNIAIAPDGATLAFVAAAASGGSEIYIRRLDGSSSRRLPGTEGGRNPFFSPDGRWIAFWADSKLKKIALDSGMPMTLCDAPDLLGGSWGDDGNIIATLTAESKLWQVSSSGGKPRAVVDTRDPVRLLWPQVLPGSRAALYSNVTLTPDSGSIDVVSLDTGTRKVLVKSGTYGRLLPNGTLVYVNQGTLYAQAFDPASLEVRGAPVAVVPDVDYSPTFGFAQFDASRTGTLVYRRNAGRGLMTLHWIARDGKTNPIVPSAGSIIWPRISPDGKRVAFVRIDNGESRIWLSGESSGQLVTSPGYYAGPLWTPDGRFLVVQGRGTLEWLPYPGSTTPKRLLSTVPVAVPWSFSPDGRRLAYYRLDPSTHFDLWTVPIAYDSDGIRAGTPEPFLKTPSIETYPAFSPDGRWIAYVSLQSGAYEVYVRGFPDDGVEVKVSKGGGRLPFWNRSRPELIYETEDHHLMSVNWRVEAGQFECGVPQPWSALQLGDTGVLPNFDLAADGRIAGLLPVASGGQSPNHVTFRLNFADEAARRLGL